jgi:hypothetical protein
MHADPYRTLSEALIASSPALVAESRRLAVNAAPPPQGPKAPVPSLITLSLSPAQARAV